MINIDYLKFISYRYDLVLRYYFLESTGFNIDSAIIMFGKRKYAFIRKRILESKGQNWPLFKGKSNWGFVLNNLSRNSEWTKEHPYIITPEFVGISVKRFLLSLHLNQPLYWTISNRYYKPITRRKVWDRDTYVTTLSLEQSKMLMDIELKMLAHMNRLKFFRPETFISESEATLY